MIDFLLGLIRLPRPEPPRLTEALAEGARREQDARRLHEASSTIRTLTHALVQSSALEHRWREDYIERCHELVEARQMAGAGPWLEAGTRAGVNQRGKLRLGEALSTQGSFGDLELALQNAEWRRDINLSWLEFSRWGIQQIILISRLYYIKNPIIRRLIDVDAYYVFGRGVEVSSPDETANDILKDFFERNQSVLGQVALLEHQKRTNYDGNLFFALFPDKQDTGKVSIRLLDASEMQDIVSDPDDADQHWYYRRLWTERTFDPQTGSTSTRTAEMWYPALGYEPTAKQQTINGIEVDWDHPVLHRKYGAVGQWQFGCPIVYPALDWAKASTKFLEACATVKKALSQIAMTITTKGGQQALAGIKQQLETTVGPSAPVWDTNPTPVNASIFASGPGTVLQAFNTKGGGGDPSEVKQFIAMCAIVMGVPPTFLGDLETANLATATTLDRPTELGFLHKQEAWREILEKIGIYVLTVSKGAPSGRLREALDGRVDVVIKAAEKIRRADGTTVYLTEAQKKKKPAKASTIEVQCTFPAILEGDLPALITATAESMTLGNKGGEVTGVDEKAGVYRMMELLDIDDRDELIEEMYPEKKKGDIPAYDPARTYEELPPPIMKPVITGGQPQAPGGHPGVPPQPGTVPVAPKAANPKVKEALVRVKAALAAFE